MARYLRDIVFIPDVVKSARLCVDLRLPHAEFDLLARIKTGKKQDRLKSARLCVPLRLSHAEFDLLDRIKTYNKKQARLRSILTFNESRKFLKEQPLSLPNCEMFILGEHFLSCGKKCLDE